jgi:integrase
VKVRILLAAPLKAQLSSQDLSVVQEVWNADLSLVEVWRSYKRTHLVESLELARLIPLYLEHLESMGRSAAYIKGMGWILDELGRHMGPGKTLGFHTTRSVQLWLLSTTNAQHKATRLKTFYHWARDNHYLSQVPKLSLPKVSTAGTTVGFLSLEECSLLIKHCPLELQGHLWLRLCMGLRVSEASRVESLQVRDGFLIVGAQAAKTRTRRVMQMLPGHLPWWEKVQPLKSLRERFEALRSEAGLTHWPNNAMRHTSASHWLNYYQDEQKAALHLGNSPIMLHRHYKALVTRKESEEFFRLWN